MTYLTISSILHLDSSLMTIFYMGRCNLKPTLSSIKKTLIHFLPGPSYGKWSSILISVTQNRLHNFSCVYILYTKYPISSSYSLQVSRSLYSVGFTVEFAYQSNNNKSKPYFIITSKKHQTSFEKS